MKIEEQITIFEHNAEHERKEGDLNNCLHFRQLAEWLKELQAYRNNLTNQSLSDALVHSENENERLHDRVNELSKELKAHREAWSKVYRDIEQLITILYESSCDGDWQYGIDKHDVLDIIDKNRPEEGDT